MNQVYFKFDQLQSNNLSAFSLKLLCEFRNIDYNDLSELSNISVVTISSIEKKTYRFSVNEEISLMKSLNIDIVDNFFVVNSIKMFNEIINDIIFMKNYEQIKERYNYLSNNIELFLGSQLINKCIIMMVILSNYFRDYDLTKKWNKYVKECINDISNNELSIYYSLVMASYDLEVVSIEDILPYYQKVNQYADNELHIAITYYYMQDKYCYINRLIDSIIYANEAIQLFSKYDCVKRIIYIKLSIANSYSKLGNTLMAIEFYNELIVTLKNFDFKYIIDDVYKNYIWMLIKNKDISEANRLFNEIDKDSSLFENQLFLYYVAYMFNELGAVLESKKYIEIGLSLPPQVDTYVKLLICLKHKVDNDDQFEDDLIALMRLALEQKIFELYEFCANQLIEIKVGQRKYKDAFEIQSSLFKTKIM